MLRISLRFTSKGRALTFTQKLLVFKQWWSWRKSVYNYVRISVQEIFYDIGVGKIVLFSTIFKVWGVKKSPVPVFPVPSPNLWINTPNFYIRLLVLTFSPYSGKISKPYLMLILLNYWIQTKTDPQKNLFFWSNLYKIEVVITSFIKS